MDSRRFAGHDTTVVSPVFLLDLPGFGPQHFKLVVHSATTRNSRGGTGFRVAKGRGRIELKCDARLEDTTSQASIEGQEYAVVLERPQGARLGVDLASQDGEPWWIKSIYSGLIEQWNRNAPLGRKVAVGDRIIEVNGISGNPAQVSQACGKTGVLHIILRRGKHEAPAFNISFGVGNGAAAAPVPPMRGPVAHRFSDQSCCGLKRTDEEFDLLVVADKATRKVAIHVEVTPVA